MRVAVADRAHFVRRPLPEVGVAFELPAYAKWAGGSVVLVLLARHAAVVSIVALACEDVGVAAVVCGGEGGGVGGPSVGVLAWWG